MKVKLHQDVLGKQAGAEVSVDATQGEWLVREGYASSLETEGNEGPVDRHLETTVDAKDDPTLAANREAPDDADVAAAEDEATNDEATKLAEVEAAKPEREVATQKRGPGKRTAKKTAASTDEPSEG